MVIDNLAVHKISGVRRAVEAVGAGVLDLPAAISQGTSAEALACRDGYETPLYCISEES